MSSNSEINIEVLLTSNELADFFYYSGLKKRTKSEEEKYQILLNKLTSRKKRKLARKLEIKKKQSKKN